MKRKAVIHVTGIVQGVGFRPFVYRVAKSLSLMGYVLNLGDAGVEIVIEGTKKQVQELISSIKNDLPSISRIDTLDIEWAPAEDIYSDFLIKKSSVIRNDDAIPVLPPDIAICNDCVRDLFNPESRWYQYGFTSCAACGPRYSTITDLPYDRPNTTMVDFPLCDTCNTGYTDPLDRRYHAQTTACDSCGPRYRLVDRSAQSFTDDNPIETIAGLIDDGAIAALQGIAGTHIATKTSDAKLYYVSRTFILKAEISVSPALDLVSVGPATVGRRTFGVEGFWLEGSSSDEHFTVLAIPFRCFQRCLMHI